MKSIQELRERLNARAKAVRELVEGNPDKWTDELQAQYTAGMQEVEGIKAEIRRIEEVQAMLADEAEANNDAELAARIAHNKFKGNPAAQSKAVKIFDKWLRGGPDALSAEDWQIVRGSAQGNGYGMGNGRFNNAMGEGTGSTGGYTVPTEVVPTVVDALKAYGGVRSVATILTTETGAPMNFPNSDGTSEVGELVAENAAATAQDINFGFTPLLTYKFSSKIVTVPIELLQDSAVDIDALVFKRCITRLGRSTSVYHTTGTGTSQPQGVVTAAQAGVVGATGQTNTITFANLLALFHSVDPAYRKLGTEFMMHDTSLQVIRGLTDNNGRPIFLPGYAGLAGALPDSLMGLPVVINQQMPQMGASAKSVLHGYFKAYIARDVMQATMFRFTDSAFAINGQVGYLMWMRCGGAFTDVGKSLMYYQNSAS